MLENPVCGQICAHYLSRGRCNAGQGLPTGTITEVSAFYNNLPRIRPGENCLHPELRSLPEPKYKMLPVRGVILASDNLSDACTPDF